jgi:hypothetical protein
MGIEPCFDLWNHFFRVQLQQGLGVEVAVWGCVDISVRSGKGIDSYFCFLMSNPLVGWQRECFFLRNDADMPFPTFMVNRPAPHPNWGYGVAQWDIRKLQPLCKVVRQLQQAGLMGAEV